MLINSTIGPHSSGVYKHWITISLTTTTGQGARGQDQTTTTTIGSVWAAIEPLSGRKLELARELVASADTEITIRYLEGVVPECTVTYGDRTFNVGAVRNLYEQSFEQVLTCVEVQ